MSSRRGRTCESCCHLYPHITMVREWCCEVFHGTQERRVRFWVVISVILSFIIAVLAIITLHDPEHYTDTYCNENRLRKAPGSDTDKPEVYNNTCQSENVLDFTPEDLKPYMDGALILHVIAGVILIITGIMALFGLRLTQARLVWPWVTATGVYIIAVIIMAFLLRQFGLGLYIRIMLGLAGGSTLAVLDVGYYCWKI